MKPLDPRLLRHARSARGYIALTAALGAAGAALVVAQAMLLAHALGLAVHDGATLGGSLDVPHVGVLIGWLAVVVLARTLVTWTQERFAHRAAARTIAELREQVVAKAAALGPRWLAEGDGPRVVTLATRGLDALEPYFVRYLPQLVLAVTVTPATLVVVLTQDWVSALIIAGTLPLIPLFMVLVGRLTEGRSARGLRVMQRLGSQVLDLLAGLSTLRALGRERGPVARVRELGDAHRRATMGTLRIAFLSGMVLELLTTLSVALVAVGIGLRLVYGDIGLVTGIAVLVLAPEVYLPLRQVGAQFHASTDGIAAADQAFAVLETPTPERGTMPCPDLHRSTLALDGVAVRAPGRDVLAPADLDLVITPGRVTALTGPSGAGKTTTVDVLLGLVRPDLGRVTITAPGAATIDLADIDPPSFWSQVAWVPQRPVLEPGTLREVVGPGADDDAVARAAAATGLDTVVASLPHGWQTPVGQGGVGLSVGQRQRVALTRAMLSTAALVILDEPTAHLDASGERVVLDTLRSLRADGRTVLVVAHRASLLAVADSVVEVRSAAVPSLGSEVPA
ncbi:thiol reductant ABC exporter subunit CydD [Cellulomonas sp. P24]|uniref:thiol reductant ABC exporter subunit CydD n=1 Tax=Cellulomonas sp. P24 TaxID=2885206 RepID=UPI00216B0E7B|nr:thiol reductant ABC exporter subunit CydD [Cellulomonas sp. P24]MCR6494028.1 thiol reductant ABC exporter subunit CydD [Cellulomonas sp. P24]